MRTLNSAGALGVAVIAVLVIILFLGAVVAVAYASSPERPMYDVPDGKDCLKWAQGKGTWTALAPNPLISQVIAGGLTVDMITTDHEPGRSLSLAPALFGVGEIKGEIWVSQSVSGPSGPVVSNWESAHKDANWDLIGTPLTEDFTGGSACLYDAGAWVFDFTLHFDGTGGARVLASVRQTVVV